MSSEIDAEQLRAKRRLLEEQLRQLDEQERQYRATSDSRSVSALNTPVTSSGSYPPQWAATVSKPSAFPGSSSSSSRNYGHQQHPPQPQIATTATSTSATSWPNQSQSQSQLSPYEQYHSLSSHGRISTQSDPQAQSQPHSHSHSHSHRPPSLLGGRSTYNAGGSQSHPSRSTHAMSTIVAAAQSSSSISPQLSPVLPTPTSASFSSSQTVPLPSAQQLHDWLRDHMGQPNGLETNWRIQGRSVDMYSLLSSVIRAGGSTEVSSRDWWPTLAGLLHLVDENTPSPTRVAMGKQLQEFFLQMLGGLEIFWERTKVAEEAANNLRRNAAATNQRPPPQTATNTSRPTKSTASYSQRRKQASPAQSARSIASVPAPTPVSSRQAHVAPSWNVEASSSSSMPVRVNQLVQPVPTSSISSTANQTHDYRQYSAHLTSHGRPSSAASSHTQASPSMPTQMHLHQPIPSHPPAHRLPEFLSLHTHAEHDRSQDSSPVLPTSIAPSALYQPRKTADITDQSAQASSSTSSEPQFAKPVQLHFGGNNIGDYLVPRLTSFQELVSSNALPLPKMSREASAINGTWSGDPLTLYSKKCHELGHAIRRLQAGQPARQISPEEVVFWAKLLAIMKRNPTVVPPPVEDRPPSQQPPTSVNPADLILKPTRPPVTDPPGSLTNPSSIALPSDSHTPGADLNPLDESSRSTETASTVRNGKNSSKRGRPKGSKNKRKDRNASPVTSGTDTPTAKRPYNNPAVPQHSSTATSSSEVTINQPVERSGALSASHPLSQILSAPIPAASIAPPADHGAEVRAPEPTSFLDSGPQLPVSQSGQVPKKRGRPKGSKTVNRKSLNAMHDPSLSNGFDQSGNAILVPASQPEHSGLGHFASLESIGQSSPAGNFEHIFQNQGEVWDSAQNAAAGPSGWHDPNSTSVAPPSSQPTDNQPVPGKKVMSEEQRNAMRKAAKARWARFEEARGILFPEVNKNQSQGKRKQKLSLPNSDSAPLIPLVQDLAPRTRIDLSGGQSAVARLRPNDMPTRIFKRTSSGASTTHAERVQKKQKTAHLAGSAQQNILASTSESYNGLYDIDSNIFESDSQFIMNPDMPVPDVSELAKALVGSVLPSSLPGIDSDGINRPEEEGEEEVVPDEAPVSTQPGKGKKRGRPPGTKKQQKQRKQSRSSLPAGSLRLASEIPGGATIDLTSARANLLARASSASPFTPRRRGVPVIELPSSKKGKVKFEVPAPGIDEDEDVFVEEEEGDDKDADYEVEADQWSEYDAEAEGEAESDIEIEEIREITPMRGTRNRPVTVPTPRLTQRPRSGVATRSQPLQRPPPATRSQPVPITRSRPTAITRSQPSPHRSTATRSRPSPVSQLHQSRPSPSVRGNASPLTRSQPTTVTRNRASSVSHLQEYRLTRSRRGPTDTDVPTASTPPRARPSPATKEEAPVKKARRSSLPSSSQPIRAAIRSQQLPLELSGARSLRSSLPSSQPARTVGKVKDKPHGVHARPLRPSPLAKPVQAKSVPRVQPQLQAMVKPKPVSRAPPKAVLQPQARRAPAKPAPKARPDVEKLQRPRTHGPSRPRPKPKRKPTGPVDRAKVVIPIRRKRRANLIAKGAYKRSRDDESDTDQLHQHMSHAVLRTMKTASQRNARLNRPASPEPVPVRFFARPGLALLEPFATVLSEQSLLNRAIERSCQWKGCDATLGSEELLKRHVIVREHAKRGREEADSEVGSARWVYRCHWSGCEEPCFKSEVDLTQHLTARHISRVLYCPYQGCGLTSPNSSHLTRHVTKMHDLPSDRPVPLADLTVRLSPSESDPLPPLPETARTDELTISIVLGSSHRSAYHIERIRQKVATHCFAGPNPIIHVEHPPHMLERIDDSDESLLDSDEEDETEEEEEEELLVDRTGWRKGRRYEVVVEIPSRGRRPIRQLSVSAHRDMGDAVGSVPSIDDDDEMDNRDDTHHDNYDDDLQSEAEAEAEIATIPGAGEYADADVDDNNGNDEDEDVEEDDGEAGPSFEDRLDMEEIAATPWTGDYLSSDGDDDDDDDEDVNDARSQVKDGAPDPAELLRQLDAAADGSQEDPHATGDDEGDARHGDVDEDDDQDEVIPMTPWMGDYQSDSEDEDEDDHRHQSEAQVQALARDEADEYELEQREQERLFNLGGDIDIDVDGGGDGRVDQEEIAATPWMGDYLSDPEDEHDDDEDREEQGPVEGGGQMGEVEAKDEVPAALLNDIGAEVDGGNSVDRVHAATVSLPEAADEHSVENKAQGDIQETVASPLPVHGQPASKEGAVDIDVEVSAAQTQPADQAVAGAPFAEVEGTTENIDRAPVHEDIALQEDRESEKENVNLATSDNSDPVIDIAIPEHAKESQARDPTVIAQPVAAEPTSEITAGPLVAQAAANLAKGQVTAGDAEADAPTAEAAQEGVRADVDEDVTMEEELQILPSDEEAGGNPDMLTQSHTVALPVSVDKPPETDGSMSVDASAASHVDTPDTIALDKAADVPLQTAQGSQAEIEVAVEEISASSLVYEVDNKYDVERTQQNAEALGAAKGPESEGQRDNPGPVAVSDSINVDAPDIVELPRAAEISSASYDIEPASEGVEHTQDVNVEAQSQAQEDSNVVSLVDEFVAQGDTVKLSTGPPVPSVKPSRPQQALIDEVREALEAHADALVPAPVVEGPEKPGDDEQEWGTDLVTEGDIAQGVTPAKEGQSLIDTVNGAQHPDFGLERAVSQHQKATRSLHLTLEEGS
ncbi:hypothetical protein I317_06256 [Kwoniella heveanensis CBS 569]|nr:hypothetical protein I317_06256 [Kwoniella heveanensis CBS 569]